MKKYFLLSLSIFLVNISISEPLSNLKEKPIKPNVVLIYIDDLGYGDVSCYGTTEIKTPNIDKFVKSGILFTDGYCSSAICTPSRFSMLTGKYAWRK